MRLCRHRGCGVYSQKIRASARAVRSAGGALPRRTKIRSSSPRCPQCADWRSSAPPSRRPLSVIKRRCRARQPRSPPALAQARLTQSSTSFEVEDCEARVLTSSGAGLLRALFAADLSSLSSSPCCPPANGEWRYRPVPRGSRHCHRITSGQKHQCFCVRTLGLWETNIALQRAWAARESVARWRRQCTRTLRRLKTPII
jgi:hypothetical protein